MLLHKKERSTLLKREIGSGGAVINKEYIGGIESLKYTGLSLAELGLSPIDWSLTRQRKEFVSFLLVSAVIMGQESSTFYPSDSIFFSSEGKFHFIVTLISQINPAQPETLNI